MSLVELSFIPLAACLPACLPTCKLPSSKLSPPPLARPGPRRRRRCHVVTPARERAAAAAAHTLFLLEERPPPITRSKPEPERGRSRRRIVIITELEGEERKCNARDHRAECVREEKKCCFLPSVAGATTSCSLHCSKSGYYSVGYSQLSVTSLRQSTDVALF